MSMSRKKKAVNIAMPKSLEQEINSISNHQDMQNEQPLNLEEAEDERYLAACALNLCTVSISQIVAYRDLNIMEQEYEMILNNLNLQMMPKDKNDALLSTLKTILNVITYFKIEDGDKNMLDIEYQHKVKNAIWSAVPSVAGVFAFDGFSAMVSLAMQVGVGYMNYRRAKADNQLEYQREEWKLERTALEQLNALRRELFDAAWRLADEYNYPEEYRLTEWQIDRYNAVLMDADPHRRYERLNYIKDNFRAYPPFWYQIAHAAAEVYLNYRSKEEKCDEDSAAIKKEYYTLAESFKQKAFAYYREYLQKTNLNLLRKDSLRAAAELELFDLKMVENKGQKENQNELINLIQNAIKDSGSEFDIVQIAAFDYLRLKENDRAQKQLLMLVNEQYNTVLNAQLLSRLYVEKNAIESKKKGNEARGRTDEVRANYRILCSRIGTEQLYPWVDDPNDSGAVNDFVCRQKYIIANRYAFFIREVIHRYTIQYNRKFPYSMKPGEDSARENDFYSDSIGAMDMRISVATKTAERYREDYLNQIPASIAERLDVLSDLCRFIERFKTDYGKKFWSKLKEKLDKEEYQRLLTRKISEADIPAVIRTMSFCNLTKEAFEVLAENICAEINSCNQMQELSQMENELLLFCHKNEYPFEQKRAIKEEASYDEFDLKSKMGEQFEKLQEEIKQKQNMIDKIKRLKEANHNKNIQIYTANEVGFDTYFENHKKISYLRYKAIAILDDQSHSNNDIVFATNGFYNRFSWNGHARFYVYGDVYLGNKCVLLGIKGKEKIAYKDFDFTIFMKIVDELQAEIPMQENFGENAFLSEYELQTKIETVLSKIQFSRECKSVNGQEAICCAENEWDCAENDSFRIGYVFPVEEKKENLFKLKIAFESNQPNSLHQEDEFVLKDNSTGVPLQLKIQDIIMGPIKSGANYYNYTVLVWCKATADMLVNKTFIKVNNPLAINAER